MASALDGARKKITQQTNEIMAWNQTLEKRVEEKNDRAAAGARIMLLRSRSLSARVSWAPASRTRSTTR